MNSKAHLYTLAHPTAHSSMVHSTHVGKEKLVGEQKGFLGHGTNEYGLRLDSPTWQIHSFAT